MRELPVGRNLLYEPKMDGFRAMVSVNSDRGVTVSSRRGTWLNDVFPEIMWAAYRHLPPRTVVDGELVCYRDGHLDFAHLQRRQVASRTAAAMSRETPCHLVVFDLLECAGEDLRRTPLRKRRARLEKLFAGIPRTCPLALGMQTDDPETARLWQEALAPVGVEGLVIKSAGSTYQPGRRGWLKLRSYEPTVMIIGGVTGHPTRPASLILGRYTTTGRLRVVGRTSTLPRPAAAEVGAFLDPAGADHPWPEELPSGWAGGLPGQRDPVRYTRVDPTMVVEVHADAAVDHGRWRHPVRYHRIRPDLDPSDVPRGTRSL